MKISNNYRLSTDSIYAPAKRYHDSVVAAMNRGVAGATTEKLMELFPLQLKKQDTSTTEGWDTTENMIEEYENSFEVFSTEKWNEFARMFMASNPPYELKAMFLALTQQP